MPDRPETTPNPLVPIWATERECQARHGRVNEDLEGLDEQGKRHDRWLVDLMGLDGNTGRVRNLENKVSQHDERIRVTEFAVAKGYAIAGLIAGAAGALGAWVMGRF